MKQDIRDEFISEQEERTSPAVEAQRVECFGYREPKTKDMGRVRYHGHVMSAFSRTVQWSLVFDCQHERYLSENDSFRDCELSG
jgi:hypothetical protein